MTFHQSQMRIALVLALGGPTAGCNSGSNGNWVEVENYGELALYLDTASVTGNARLRTFKTKLATPGWKGLFSNAEIRDTYQIDCKAKTLRKLESSTHEERLGSGKVGTRGYGKLLYDRVCP